VAKIGSAVLQLALGSAVALTTVSSRPALGQETAADTAAAAPAAAAATGKESVVSDEAGQQAKATEDPAETPAESVRILLDLSDRAITVFRGSSQEGPWPVAIGDPNTPTPTGTFRIENKVLNPQYQSTKSGRVNPTIGPNSPLGDRWLGFLQSGPNQFGIHGTPWPHWVNTRAAVTNGCVRMKHAHVRRLFEIVDVGTPIVIQP
jgi:lipoprotein-anchoring transpeptidase ErfK/SrfK